MVLKGILKGVKMGVTSKGNPAFEGYIECDPESGKSVTFGKDDEIAGTVLHAMKCWGDDAKECYEKVCSEKLLDKKIIAKGTLIKYTFQPCDIKLDK